jgi:hypothetical protein
MGLLLADSSPLSDWKSSLVNNRLLAKTGSTTPVTTCSRSRPGAEIPHAQIFTLGEPLDRWLSRGICSLVRATRDRLALFDLNSKDHSRE